MADSPDLLKPLMFSQAMEQHKADTKDCKLFELPDEILACILDWMIAIRVDFRSLALVNRDFRQFARSHQFRVVTFDGSKRCYDGILAQLMLEALERRQGRSYLGQTHKPSIGACIRKLVVNRSGEVKHDGRLQRGKKRRKEFAAGGQEHHDSTMHSVIGSLPNLDTSNVSTVFLGHKLLNSLVGSTINTVTLDVRAADICPRMVPGATWPITSLTLKLSETMGMGFAESRSLCWETVLRLCAPTLQRLSMSACVLRFDGRKDGRDGRLSFDLSFPELTCLDIKWARLLGRSALQSLLLTSRKLHYLSIDCTAEEVREMMDRPEGFVALRTLVANYMPRIKLGIEIPGVNLKFMEKLPQVTHSHSLEAALRGLQRTS